MPARPTRRVLAALAAAAALVLPAACSAGPAADPAAPPTVAFQTSWTPNVQFGGTYIAQSEGLYAKQGITVDILPGGPEVNSIPIVQSGRAMVGVSNANDVAAANQQGADLVILGAGFQKNPFAVMSLATKPLRTPKDLEGRKLGVPSVDAFAVNALITANKLDASTITIVPVGFDVAPLTSGEVDGLVVFDTDAPVTMELAGIPATTFLFADYGLDVYAQTYFTTRTALKEHRAEIRSFLAGELAGWTAYLADPTKAAQLTVDVYAKDVGLKLDAQTLQAQRQLRLITNDDTKSDGLFWMSKKGIDANLAAFTLVGVQGTTPDLFDTSLLTELRAGT